MYLTRIRYRGLRGLADFEDLTFRYPGDGREDQRLPNVNLFTGRNGSGKTTLLQAITAGLQGRFNTGLIARSELRRSTSAEAELIADRQLDERDVSAGIEPQEQLRLRPPNTAYQEEEQIEVLPQKPYWDEQDRARDAGLAGFVVTLRSQWLKIVAWLQDGWQSRRGR